MITLSIRQPWAWLIAHGHKPVENRSWSTFYRGPLLIHAGKGMTKREYEESFMFAHGFGVRIPLFTALERGGIVGIAALVDCRSYHDSPWYAGDIAWVLRDARPLPFFECRGALGLFNVEYPKELLHATP